MPHNTTGALARLGWGAALLCASEGLVELLVAPRHAPLDTQVSETYLGVSRLYILRARLRDI